MDLFTIGFPTALSLQSLMYCFFGVFLGTFIGALPGVGALAAVSLLFPLTFHLDAVSGLVMLAGVYYGSEYGGSTSSILLNLPGGPANAVTCLDGYPLARQGRAGVALLATTLASFFGGSVGIVMLMLFTPWIVAIALSFQSADFFAAMLLALVASSAIGQGSPLKGFASMVLGILIGCVGVDMTSGQARLDFGILELAEGISLVVLAMGLFGLAEVALSVDSHETKQPIQNVGFRSMVMKRDEVRQSTWPTIRGTFIGSILGALPGTGPTIASFIGYAVEKRISKHPERFGTGVIEGITSPEAANNAAAQTAFIPTLSLGIPGSATMAIMMGAMLIQGITPGPRLLSEHPDLFWGLVASFWIGNLMLLILNVPLIGIWVKLLQIPYHLLYPPIVVMICVATYGLSSSTLDVWLVLIFGALGLAFKLLDFPAAPLLIGFILGPLIEQNFLRAMMLADGDIVRMLERPIAAGLLAITVVILIWSGLGTLRPYLKSRALQH